TARPRGEARAAARARGRRAGLGGSPPPRPTGRERTRGRPGPPARGGSPVALGSARGGAVLPATVSRSVRDDAATRRIREATRERGRACAVSPRGIEARLRELDREWDLERTLEANASSLALAGLALGAFVDRRFYLLPTAVAGF